MKLKRLFVVAAVGGLAVPTYWHTVSATELGDTECHDNRDNDNDGGIDFHGDPDCTGFDDDDESGPLGQPAGNTTNTSTSSSSANNTNENTSTNTSTNTNTNTSSSNSSSQSASQSGSSSTSCVLLCDATLLSDVLSGLPL